MRGDTTLCHAGSSVAHVKAEASQAHSAETVLPSGGYGSTRWRSARVVTTSSSGVLRLTLPTPG